MRPRPRTSLPPRPWMALCSTSPISAAWPTSPSRSMTVSTASAAAHASGLPPNVEPWSPGSKTSAFGAARQAPMGTPPPRPLASVITSGVMPWCWCANQRPVRPSPVCTSSRMSSKPCSSHHLRTPARYPGFAGMTPISPITGSSITATARARGGFDGVEVVVSDVDEPFRQGLEGIRVFGLPPGRDGSEGAAVERAERRDDRVRAVAIAGAPLACDLDRGLVGLGAGVAQEDARRERELDLGLGVVEVGRVDEGLRLRGQRGRDLRVRVAEKVDCNAGDEVEVFVAGVVVDEAAAPAHEGDLQAPTRLHQVPVRELGGAHRVT